MAKILSIIIRHLISCALVAQHYNIQLAIQRLVVRILPLAPGEATWQKYYQQSLVLNYWCTGSTVVEHPTNYPKIEGSKTTNGTGRNKMAKMLSIKIIHLISCALIAQRYYTQLAIQRLRVQILSLGSGEAIWQKYYQ
jgi:hypothetical protein